MASVEAGSNTTLIIVTFAERSLKFRNGLRYWLPRNAVSQTFEWRALELFASIRALEFFPHPGRAWRFYGRFCSRPRRSSPSQAEEQQGN